jgi:hypothetical protein
VTKRRSKAGDAFSARDRARFGCIVTFEGADGRTITAHRTGPTRVALRAACEAAQSLDGSLRVVSISTPTTILSDLVGRGSPQPSSSFRGADRPEPQLLAGAGLSHMLHERLRGRGLTSDRRWREHAARRATEDLGGVDERSSPGSSIDAPGAVTRLAPAPPEIPDADEGPVSP